MSLSDADSIGGELLNEKLEMRSEYELLTKDLILKNDITKTGSPDNVKDLSRKRKREESSKVYDINKCNFIDYIDTVEDDTQLCSKSNSSLIEIKEQEGVDKSVEEEIKAINSFQSLFSKTLKIEMSGLKIKQVIDVDLNSINEWKFQENFKKRMYLAYNVDSKEFFNMIRSEKVKCSEIERYFEELFNNQGLFYNVSQKRKLLTRMKDFSKSYCGNKLVFTFIKRKIEEFK